MAEGDRKESVQSQLWAAAGQYTGYGLTWALSTLLFLLAGWWLDGKVGTTPLFMILGSFVGAGAGFYSLYYHVVVEPREREDEDGEP
jgi:F0F1-type ATP synthase assembly protein I